jgi:uncharacterized protein (DUF58 family)
VLTSRGSWFLFVVLMQTALGLIWSSRVGPIVAVLGLVALGWFVVEWLLFQARVHFVAPKIAFRRVVRAERREVPIVWAGQEFDVIVHVKLDASVGLPYVVVQDRPPSGCDRVNGLDYRIGALSAEEGCSIEYRLRCDVPGEIRFEGARLQLADLQGFFYHRSFRRAPAQLLVLPPLADAEGKRRTTKAHNVLPPPGVHRLRQTGGGSELHDLRDYRPGDPPKMIAWKASARRDRLITKEFESDVPVRCTLFVDASPSVRIGPARETMLHQITTIASAVSQAALADRDHVGLVLFDDQDVEVMPPARTSRHLIELLHRLARANSAAPISPCGDVDELMPLANPLAHELYPDLMDRRINTAPLSMSWRPLLDSRWAWPVLVLLLPLALLIGWFEAAVLCYLFDYGEGLHYVWHAGGIVKEQAGSLANVLFVTAASAALALVYWGVYGLSGFLPSPRVDRLRRKQLAAALAAIDDAPMETEARYLDDDAAFSLRLQRFLAQHHRRYPVALFDDDGRYLFRSEEKIDVLSRSLLRSVARGRDNELFVILADLFELQEALEPLLRAVRVACARHHHVLVICPWLHGVPALDEKLEEAERARAIRAQALEAGFRGIQAQLFRQTVEQFHASFQALRREFGKSGVLLVRASPRESVRLILNRLDRLRGVRARR